MSAGLIKLDSQKRVSLGKYTNLRPGEYLQIERTEDGTLILRPARLQPVLREYGGEWTDAEGSRAAA